MDIIDDQGRLFGAINIIDALVVLLVLAIVVAGVAFVSPFSDNKTEPDNKTENVTRYATLDLGAQNGYIASLISEGDRMSLENSRGNLTVTDVYRSPTKNDKVSIILRAELEGVLTKNSQNQTVFRFNDSTPRVGEKISIRTLDYSITGSITNLQEDRDRINTKKRTITVKMENIRPEIASSISAGMSEKINDQKLAEVLDKRVEPATITLTSDSGEIFKRQHPVKKDVYMDVRVTTRNTNSGLQFHGEPLRIGNNVVFEFENLDIKGTVTEIK